MISCKPNSQRLTLLFSFLLMFSVANISAQDGKALFNSKCASCHNVFKDLTGPKLGGASTNDYFGGDMKKMYNWIYNVNTMIKSDPYFSDLQKRMGSVMTQYDKTTLPEKDIDAIFEYVNTSFAAGPGGGGGGTGTGGTAMAQEKSSNQNAVIFGVISLILAIIALILMQVNSNLKKMSDDVEGIMRPDPVPFYKNKVYIAMVTILLFVVGGYYVTKGAIGMGRQKGYQPIQPVYYSHKVHAGINQINCLYCHGSAWESKTAGVPSVNTCMNCHKAINEYVKGPKLYNVNGDEIDGTAEIAKLYKAAGFDPKNPSKWDPDKAIPIEWVKIHNLPDHVYFNHSQHIRAGKVQCQTCHGEITAMDEVKQVADLSMGWCVNCHRETKIDFDYSNGKGNKFYSIYEKFHNDFKSGKMDSLTVKDIGGIECQKCHY